MRKSRIRFSRKEPIEPYLNSFINYERYKYFPRKVDLRDYKNFLRKIGDPQKKLSPSVLIAGTNGKGSTAAIISSVLSEEGYRIGLFTSPHILSYRERIRVNGKNISKRDFSSCLSSLKPYLNEPHQKSHRTFFEVLATVSFFYFKNKKTDLNIFEVGLGGRLDATNVINPIISVITSIGFDHTRTLGKTLSKIAREKCGIIKTGGTVISSSQHSNAMKTIEKVTSELKAELYKTEEMIKIKPYVIDNKGIKFTFKGEGFSIPLRGSFQLDNIRTALLTFELLKKKGFSISNQAMRRGLKKTVWKGRLEIVRKEPLIILDGAHNPSAMRRIVKSLKGLYPKRRIILIFSCLSSKDKKAMASILEKAADKIILTRINALRAAVVSEIKKLFKKPIYVRKDIKNALKLAIEFSSENTLILITGSIYLISETYEVISKHFKEKI